MDLMNKLMGRQQDGSKSESKDPEVKEAPDERSATNPPMCDYCCS